MLERIRIQSMDVPPRRTYSRLRPARYFEDSSAESMDPGSSSSAPDPSIWTNEPGASASNPIEVNGSSGSQHLDDSLPASGHTSSGSAAIGGEQQHDATDKRNECLQLLREATQARISANVLGSIIDRTTSLDSVVAFLYIYDLERSRWSDVEKRCRKLTLADARALSIGLQRHIAEVRGASKSQTSNQESRHATHATKPDLTPPTSQDSEMQTMRDNMHRYENLLRETKRDNIELREQLRKMRGIMMELRQQNRGAAATTTKLSSRTTSPSTAASGSPGIAHAAPDVSSVVSTPDDPAPSHSDSESTISERHGDNSQHGPTYGHLEGK